MRATDAATPPLRTAIAQQTARSLLRGRLF